MQDDDNQVQEGEIISPPEVDIPSGNAISGDTASFLDLTGIINNHLSQIEGLKQEAAKYKEMLDSIYQNDPTYQLHDKAVKEATKIRSNTKKQIQKLPQAADLVNRIQSLKSSVKELSQAMSEYLQDYARTTGSTSFETTDGEVRQIVYVAKLVKPVENQKDFRQ